MKSSRSVYPLFPSLAVNSVTKLSISQIWDAKHWLVMLLEKKHITLTNDSLTFFQRRATIFNTKESDSEHNLDVDKSSCS